MKKHKLEYIEWADSIGVGSSWEHMENLAAKLHVCFSVGWIVKETRKVIVVVPHISPKSNEHNSVDSGCGDMTIPKSAIIKRKRLEV